MSNIKFYIILNLVNVLLIIYLFGMISMMYYLLFNKDSIFFIIIPILNIPIKFFLLFMIFKIVERFFQKSFMVKFINKIKNDSIKRKQIINLSIIYDFGSIIFILFLISNNNIIMNLTIPIFWELITFGGVLVFYKCLFHNLDVNGQLK